MAKFRNWLRLRNWVFLSTVLAPTLIAVFYYGLFASDVYVSESRFVVRNPQRQLQTGLGSLLQSTGFTRSQDDTYSVHDYVLSRDALKELDIQLEVRKAFSSNNVDVINRFPGLDWDDSFEAFHRYYQHRVSIDYDTVSSISVLQVRAFTAQDSVKINDLLLQMGERLVNNLNDRSRKDLISVARQEVELAEEKSKVAALALSGFRSAQAVFDPEKQSALQLAAVVKLQEELRTSEAQLLQLQKLSPANPNIAALKDQVGNLRKTVEQEKTLVTGVNRSLTSKSANYDRFVLEKGFADRQLATSLVSLESAKSEAIRKQLYLERLVQPNLPDKAMEPRRIRSVFTVFLLGLIGWGVVSLLVASVREHTD